jgi:peptidyl-prolyl cis-trans isomerase C
LALAGPIFLAALSGAAAQTGPKKPVASPAAPGDLTKPAFDTKTPVYDKSGPLNKSASTVVAEVEGRAITLGEVGDAIRALPPAVAQLPLDALFPHVVETLIKQQALVVRAQQQGLDEDPTVRRRMRAASDRELSNEYLRREIGKSVTEESLLARYNSDVAGKPGAWEAKVRVIMVPTEKEAAATIAELRGGADFAAVARRVSKDTTARIGGDLGFVTRDGLLPEVGAVAFALAPGELSANPVRTASGWFAVKVEERRARPAPSFAEARPALEETLLREGVGPESEAALRGLTVREYNLIGKEGEPGAKAGDEAR